MCACCNGCCQNPVVSSLFAAFLWVKAFLCMKDRVSPPAFEQSWCCSTYLMARLFLKIVYFGFWAALFIVVIVTIAVSHSNNRLTETKNELQTSINLPPLALRFNKDNTPFPATTDYNITLFRITNTDPNNPEDLSADIVYQDNRANLTDPSLVVLLNPDKSKPFRLGGVGVQEMYQVVVTSTNYFMDDATLPFVELDVLTQSKSDSIPLPYQSASVVQMTKSEYTYSNGTTTTIWDYVVSSQVGTNSWWQYYISNVLKSPANSTVYSRIQIRLGALTVRNIIVESDTQLAKRIITDTIAYVAVIGIVSLVIYQVIMRLFCRNQTYWIPSTTYSSIIYLLAHSDLKDRIEENFLKAEELESQDSDKDV